MRGLKESLLPKEPQVGKLRRITELGKYLLSSKLPTAKVNIPRLHLKIQKFWFGETCGLRFWTKKEGINSCLDR